MTDTFSDGFTDIGRNCGCGGVFVLVDRYHGKCGMCNTEKLTQDGKAKLNKKSHAEMLAKMQAERDAYNAENPGEV